MSTVPQPATHLLIHRYIPGTGPQEGTAELEAEMRVWQQIDQDLRRAGVLVSAYAVADSSHTLGQSLSQRDDMVFAVHAVVADSQAAAEQVAERMPHLGYGSTEVRPLMDAEAP